MNKKIFITAVLSLAALSTASAKPRRVYLGHTHGDRIPAKESTEALSTSIPENSPIPYLPLKQKILHFSKSILTENSCTPLVRLVVPEA